MKISACGLVCEDCEFFNKTCTGCYNVKGSTFWAVEMMPQNVCPLFNCSVNGKAFINCGDCPELPCKMFIEMKDPNLSDKEHEENIVKRVALLKGA